MTHIIGLYSSRAQSGKSTVARHLQRFYGYWIVRFAGPLKDMVRALLLSMGTDEPTVERMVEGDLKSEVIPGFDTVTPRQLMQTLGTDWGREAVSNDLWMKTVGKKIESLDGNTRGIVIDDLRFPNEFDMLRERGATLWRVVRPDAPQVGSSRYEGLLDDREFDHVLMNAGTRLELCEMTDRRMECPAAS